MFCICRICAHSLNVEERKVQKIYQELNANVYFVTWEKWKMSFILIFLDIREKHIKPYYYKRPLFFKFVRQLFSKDNLKSIHNPANISWKPYIVEKNLFADVNSDVHLPNSDYSQTSIYSIACESVNKLKLDWFVSVRDILYAIQYILYNLSYNPPPCIHQYFMLYFVHLWATGPRWSINSYYRYWHLTRSTQDSELVKRWWTEVAGWS